MAKAVWNSTVIAESDSYEVVEGSIYFPADSVKQGYLRPSDTVYECPWKGHADYYDIVIGDKVLTDSVWQFPEPKTAAGRIRGHFAFDKTRGVEIHG